METTNISVDNLQDYEKIIYYFVEDLMLALSFRNCLVGRVYLRDCLVQVCIEDKHNVNLAEEIYPVIAKRYSCSEASVSKAIRHSLITCFNDGGLKRANRIFSYEIVGKTPPTNAEFITTMAILIKRFLRLRDNKSSQFTYFNL